MTTPSGLAALANGAVLSPFTQLRKLLGAGPAGHSDVIDLTIGEPREPMPAFVAEKLIEAMASYAQYPPIRGTAALRGAISAWAARRYGAVAAPDPEREILPINGSREGLFLAALPAAGRKSVDGKPAVLMCNPYYSAYIGGALAVDAEAYLPQRHRGDRLSPRPRRACRRCAATQADDRVLPLLAGQSARLGRIARLHCAGAGAGTRLRLHPALR